MHLHAQIIHVEEYKSRIITSDGDKKNFFFLIFFFFLKGPIHPHHQDLHPHPRLYTVWYSVWMVSTYESIDLISY